MPAHTNTEVVETPAEVPTETPAEPSAEAPKAEQDSAPKDWESEAAKWKAMARKSESQAKTNAEKAKAYDEAQEAAKTEQQRLADKLADAERRLGEAQLKADRAEVAQRKGVPVELVSGATVEEMEASADALTEWRGAPAAASKPDTTGMGKVGEPIGTPQGQLTRAELKNMTPEQIVQAKKDGKLDQVLQVKTL